MFLGFVLIVTKILRKWGRPSFLPRKYLHWTKLNLQITPL